MKRSEQKQAVADRMAALAAQLPAEQLPANVTPLNAGFFRLEQIRYHARPKERADVRQVMEGRK